MTEKYIKLKIYSLDGGVSSQLPYVSDGSEKRTTGWGTEENTGATTSKPNGKIFFPMDKDNEVRSFISEKTKIIITSTFPENITRNKMNMFSYEVYIQI